MGKVLTTGGPDLPPASVSGSLETLSPAAPPRPISSDGPRSGGRYPLT